MTPNELRNRLKSINRHIDVGKVNQLNIIMNYVQGIAVCLWAEDKYPGVDLDHDTKEQLISKGLSGDALLIVQKAQLALDEFLKFKDGKPIDTNGYLDTNWDINPKLSAEIWPERY